ncbi:MAG TPA: DUF4476 domain-containing protein [Cytophagaceae bacterium]|nr:DUF4476 domain-containing protein [Cytophagaceae bacterium]
MKKIFLLLLLSLMMQFEGSCQAPVINNLVVFSNDGEKFTLILNGEKQNQYPDSRIKVADLTLKVYKVTLIFENKKLKTHNTTLTFFSTNEECVFTLNKHGNKHTMDYVTATAINQPAKQNTTATNTNTTTTATNTSTKTNTTTNSSINNNGSEDIAIKTSLGTFDVGSNGIKIGGKGVNLNLNEKTKTASSSVNVLGNTISMNKSFKIGCKSPMSGLDFDESKKTVVSQTTDSTRMIAAEKVINANCMLTAQVKEIMQLFTTDLTKLHFAKKAYSHTSDLSNYGQLDDTFTSEEGKKDLHNFIKNPK